ncbi:MAG TPA: hypothetical protein VMD08_03880 [Candidatus Baltobacteraceae bacterium]|nr:hypothetical protein [Candidatus Baltobacteraceae bacterium]
MGGEISGETPWRRSRQTLRPVSPAAGADWSVTVPAGHIYRLRSVLATLVTSAAVATRIARLTLNDGNGVFVDVPPFGTQAAGLTRRYLWLPSPAAVAQGNGILSSLPEFDLMAGWSLSTVTDAIDVADQWSAVAIGILDVTAKGGDVNLEEFPELFIQLV